MAANAEGHRIEEEALAAAAAAAAVGGGGDATSSAPGDASVTAAASPSPADASLLGGGGSRAPSRQNSGGRQQPVLPYPAFDRRMYAMRVESFVMRVQLSDADSDASVRDSSIGGVRSGATSSRRNSSAREVLPGTRELTVHIAPAEEGYKRKVRRWVDAFREHLYLPYVSMLKAKDAEALRGATRAFYQGLLELEKCLDNSLYGPASNSHSDGMGGGGGGGGGHRSGGLGLVLGTGTGSSGPGGARQQGAAGGGGTTSIGARSTSRDPSVTSGANWGGAGGQSQQSQSDGTGIGPPGGGGGGPPQTAGMGAPPRRSVSGPVGVAVAFDVGGSNVASGMERSSTGGVALPSRRSSMGVEARWPVSPSLI